MLILKQSTAITLKMGPFLDSTDGNTVEAGLAIAQADVRLSKNGGNYAQKNHVGAGVYDEGGWYDIPLDATDTNTLGRLVIFIHEAGALQVWERAMVMPAQEWDSLFGADVLQVDLVQWIGVAPLALNAQRVQSHLGATDAGAIVAATFAAGAIDAAAIANAAIDAATFAANALDAVWDALRAGHAGAGSFGQGVASVQGNVVGTVASVVGNLGGDVVGDVQGDVLGNVIGTVASVIGNVGGNVVGTVASVIGNLGGNVGGNVTGSVASMLAAGRNQIADSTLIRNLNNVDAIAPFRSLAGASGKSVNRVAQALGFLNIYRTDDVTLWGSQAITEDVLANPIVEFDTV